MVVEGWLYASLHAAWRGSCHVLNARAGGRTVGLWERGVYVSEAI